MIVGLRALVSDRSTSGSATPHGVSLTFAAARTSQGTMASMASSLAGTPILARPRASKGTKSRRAMRCNASAVSDAAAADMELGYPFVKIVGQEELKLALTLNVVVRVPAVFTGATRPTSRARRRRRPKRFLGSTARPATTTATTIGWTTSSSRRCSEN